MLNMHIGFLVRTTAGLCLLIAMSMFSSGDARAQSAACTTTGYASAYDVCSSTNSANQASTTVTSSQAVQAAVAQTAGLVASRISSFTASAAAPSQSLRAQSHYKVFALGNGGITFNSKMDESITRSKADEKADIAKLDDASENETEDIGKSKGLAAGGMNTKIGIWADVAYSRLIYSKTDENYDGYIASGVIGVDYAIDKKTLVGVAVGYEDVDLDTEFNRGSLEGSGWTLSPYLVYKYNDNYSVDFSGGYTWLNYDLERLDPGDSSKITGDQDAARWFVSANIKGDHWYDKTHVSGTVGFLHAREDQDDFTESNLTNTSGVATNVGQGYIGVRLGYLFDMEGGSVEPYVRALGRYSYDDGGSGDSSDAIVGAGASMNYGNIQFGAEGSAVVGREDTNNFTGRVNIRANF